MTPDQFLVVARNLTSSKDAGPAEFRTSISRSYYFAYHRAKNLIEKELGISMGGGGRENLHLHLQQYLLNSGLPEAAQAGRLLRDLHEGRKEADYSLHLRRIESQEHALGFLYRAEELDRDLKTLATEPFRTPLIAGMTRYHKLQRGLS